MVKMFCKGLITAILVSAGITHSANDECSVTEWAMPALTREWITADNGPFFMLPDTKDFVIIISRLFVTMPLNKQCRNHTHFFERLLICLNR